MDDKEAMDKIWSFYNGYSEDILNTEELYGNMQDPNFIYNGKPLLCVAAEFVDVKGIKKLLALGADPDSEYESMHNNSLHLMAYGKAKSIRKYEIPKGAVKEAALILLAAGVSSLRKNEDGRTCAYIAAENGNYEMLEALVQEGKKMDLTDKKGNTPLHAACGQAKHIDESFFKYTEPRYAEAMKRTPSYEGEERIIEMQKTSSKEQYDQDKGRVDDYFKTVKVLYDGGMDPDKKNDYGETAKDLAAKCMDVRISAVLNGIYSEDGSTSDTAMRTKGMNVGQALMNNDHDALAAILELGADPNEVCSGKLRRIGTDLDGKTPLGVTCAFLDAKGTELLLNSGADPNLKDPSGRAPAAYCISASANGNTLSNKIPDKILDMMLEKGMGIDNNVDEKGNTLLNLACKHVNSSSSYNGETLPGRFIELLIKKKANVNMSDNDGVTPLMRACVGDSRTERIQLYLLEKEADVGARDKKGNTPLMYAAMNRKGSMGKTMAEMLFEFGDPHIDAVNNEGKTALEIATEKDNEELVKFILGKM